LVNSNFSESIQGACDKVAQSITEALEKPLKENCFQQQKLQHAKRGPIRPCR